MTLTATQPRLDPDSSQRAFEVLLRSLAEPGTIHRFDTGVLAPDVPAAAMLVLTLADVEIAVNVDADVTHPLAATLCATTGATSTDIADADLVVLTTPDPHVLEQCATGSALEPEQGTRIAVRVAAIHLDPDPDDHVLTLTGPGIPGERTMGLSEVTPAFLRALAVANHNFPAGFDTWIVTDDGEVCALPRSTNITLDEPIDARPPTHTPPPKKEN